MAKTTTAKKVDVVETSAQKPVEKTVKKPTRTTAKKIEAVYVQFGKLEWNTTELTQKAKAAYVAEGHKATSIKKFCLYVKPEESKAYYVVNDVDTGSIEL